MIKFLQLYFQPIKENDNDNQTFAVRGRLEIKLPIIELGVELVY